MYPRRPRAGGDPSSVCVTLVRANLGPRLRGDDVIWRSRMSSLPPHCDRALAEGKPDASAGAARAAHPNLVLATSILSSSLAFIDGSVVNVGLAAIGKDLAGTGASLSWIVNGYMLPLSSLLLLG